jgi:hypothetical protein
MLFAIDIVVLDGEWNVMATRRELRPFRMTRVFWKAAAVSNCRSRGVEPHREGDIRSSIARSLLR